MLKTAPKVFILILLLLSGCSDDERIGSVLHTINYYEDGHLYMDKLFSYDEEGKLIQTLRGDLNNEGSSPSIGSVEYTADQTIYQEGLQYNYFTFDEGKLAEYVFLQDFPEEDYTGTMTFSYASGNLAGFTFEGESYVVETDMNGNVTRISGNGVDYQFSFDDKKNPLQGVPGYLFYIGLVTHTKYILYEDFVRYFSKNNIVGNGYSCKYDQGKVVKISHKEGSTTWSQKIQYQK